MSSDLTLSELIEEIGIPEKYRWIFRFFSIRLMDAFLELTHEYCHVFKTKEEVRDVIKYVKLATEQFIGLLDTTIEPFIESIEDLKEEARYWWLLTRDINGCINEIVEKIKKYF